MTPLLFLSLVCYSILPWLSSAALVPPNLPEGEPTAELTLLDVRDIDPRQEYYDPDKECTNTPLTRGCWGNGLSIATNYDYQWPRTGNVVSYDLELLNVTLAPDGVPRRVLAVNGKYPGPLIRAQWGDVLQITVRNHLQVNGTSMHWHGVRQRDTNSMDGTNGITECPLAPGQVRTYTFNCTQFGTTWYHSHFSNQYSDGVVGTLIIDGPATANYDVDLGAYPITDWFYTPVSELTPLVQHGAFPLGAPLGDNILINGTNVNTVNHFFRGHYARTKLAKGTSYRLRLINTATNDNFKIGLDGHTLQVIASDFVPIRPFYTDWLFIAIGQRYDVIIHANADVASYWFHVIPVPGCSANRNQNAVSIFEYEGASSDTPSSSDRYNRPEDLECADPNDQIVPYVKLDVPYNGTIPRSSDLDVGFRMFRDDDNVTEVQWTLNFTAIEATWDYPTLEHVLNNDYDFDPSMNVIMLPQANQWSIWVIQAGETAVAPIPHPIHLHGHDFYVLGTGTGTFDNTQSLKFENAPRRDVATLPADGYLVVGFITDNPGAWLMHCHIAWHISLGLGAQFLVRPADIPQVIPFPDDWWEECETWNEWDRIAPYHEEDSGL